MSPARYPSLAHRKQTFKRGEARDKAIREEVASWSGGVPPEEPEREISYAPNLLPTVSGRVHGLIQEDPVWVVQCDGCGRVAVGDTTKDGRRTTLVIQFCGVHFGYDDPRRLCARCRVNARWKDYDTTQCRDDKRYLEFYEGWMREREPALFEEGTIHAQGQTSVGEGLH